MDSAAGQVVPAEAVQAGLEMAIMAQMEVVVPHLLPVFLEDNLKLLVVLVVVVEMEHQTQKVEEVEEVTPAVAVATPATMTVVVAVGHTTSVPTKSI